jgi:hypothetical protein
MVRATHAAPSVAGYAGSQTLWAYHQGALGSELTKDGLGTQTLTPCHNLGDARPRREEAKDMDMI